MRNLFYLIVCVFFIFLQCDNPFTSEDINKPKNFSINQSWDGIALTWDDNNEYEDGYYIFRNNQKITTLDPGAIEFLDFSFSPFEPLAYHVSCFKDGETSKDTDIQNISIALKFYDRFSNYISTYWYNAPDSTVLTHINGEMNVNGNDNDGYQHNAYFYKDINTPFTFGVKLKKITGNSSEPFGVGIRSESTGARIFTFISVV